MPTTRRKRVIAADPAQVWAVCGDPYQLPRWWPRVERVEQVTAGAFTEVLRSDRGRAVRADHRLTDLREGERIEWTQMLENTPFERVMSEAVTRVSVVPVPDGTRVELERKQSMRGMARFGGFLIRRATGRVLDDALDALEERVGPS